MRKLLALACLALAALALPQDNVSRANVPFDKDAQGTCAPGQKSPACVDSLAAKACAGKPKDVCKAEYEASYKAYRASGKSVAPERMQFHATDPETQRDPEDLVKGKQTGYQPMSVPAHEIAADSFLAFREKDRAAAIASAGPARKFSAHPKYLEDGAKVKSCAEYVYKKFFDWSQYEDQVFACKEDLSCLWDVALFWLADKKLKDSDSAEIPSMSWWRKTSSSKPVSAWPEELPKNAYFTIALPPLGISAEGKPLVGPDKQPLDPLAVIMPAMKDDLPEIRALLAEGESFYAFDKNAHGPHGFKDEWDFHEKMHERIKAVDPAVQEEMEWRTRRVERLLGSAGALRWAETHADIHMPTQQDPTDVLGPDPWERLQAYADVNMFRSQYLGGMDAYGGVATVRSAKLAPPPPPPALAPTPKRVSVTAFAVPDGQWRLDPDPKQHGRRLLCTPATTQIVDRLFTEKGMTTTLLDGMGECQAWNLLFDEYDRLKRNRAKGCTAGSNCGCLHIAKNGEPESYGCDWSLSKFAGRWVRPNHFIKDRTIDWNYCHRFFGFAGKAKAKDEESLASFEAKVKEDHDAYKNWGKLPVVSDQMPLSFGQTFGSSAKFGDKDTFAAGYAYDAGWELEPIALVPGTTKVAQMSARAWGAFDADAWVLKDDIRIVDAAAWIVANKASKNHPDGSRKVEYSAHFTLLGMQLFKEPKSLPDTPTPEAGWYKFDKDHPDDSSGEHQAYQLDAFNQTATSHGAGGHPDLTIPDPPLSATVMVGPIPVTIAGGASLSFGATLKPSVNVPKGHDKEIKDFGVKLTFQPYVKAGAFVTGGVGIPGCEVDLRADVTLVNLTLPVTADLGIGEKNGHLELDFGVGVTGMLSTLGGKLSLEIQFLVWDEMITLFKWTGLGPYKFEILPRIGGTYKLAELEDYIKIVCAKSGTDPAKNPVCAPVGK